MGGFYLNSVIYNKSFYAKGVEELMMPINQLSSE